jgi:hypothetical protein
MTISLQTAREALTLPLAELILHREKYVGKWLADATRDSLASADAE